MELFEAERPVPGGALAGYALDNRPSNAPVNAQSIPSRIDFSDT